MGGLFSYSVESISETVTVPAGTFNYCLKIRLVITNASGDTTQTNSYYYAPGIGEVLNTLWIPGFEKDAEFKLIEYNLPQDSNVTLSIYNISGQQVAVLKNDIQTAGDYYVSWNADDLPSGLYFCNLRADGFAETRKMVLVR